MFVCPGEQVGPPSTMTFAAFAAELLFVPPVATQFMAVLLLELLEVLELLELLELEVLDELPPTSEAPLTPPPPQAATPRATRHMPIQR